MTDSGYKMNVAVINSLVTHFMRMHAVNRVLYYTTSNLLVDTTQHLFGIIVGTVTGT